MFQDRADAGRQLASRLLYLKDKHPVVLALPRGGVPVGFEIASALGAQMDLTMNQAAESYLLLTVGDGLVTQIPAIIVSTAAGMVG